MGVVEWVKGSRTEPEDFDPELLELFKDCSTEFEKVYDENAG